MRSWCTAFLTASLTVSLTASLPAQPPEPGAFVEDILRSSPTTLSLGSAGTLTSWKVTDPTSPSLGLTLLWLELNPNEIDVRLNNEQKPDSDFVKASPKPLIIASGGAPATNPSAPGSPRRWDPAGLVIADDVALNPRLADWKTGAVFLRCGSDVMITPIADYRRAAVMRGTSASIVTPCAFSNSRTIVALQSEALLVNGGKPGVPPAAGRRNRLAIGVAQKKLVIAGAFNDTNTALELPPFAVFLALAAKKQQAISFSAIELEGSCSAYLWIPSKQQRWGCKGPIYSPNRFLIRER